MVNICGGGGVILSVIAVVLLVFGEIGQLNTAMIPRHLRIVSLSTQGFGAAAGVNPSTAVYNAGTVTGDKGTVPNAGLRMTYEWGLWSYCATNSGLGTERSYCSSRKFGAKFEPAMTLYNDVPLQFQSQFNSTVPANVFRDDSYLGRFSMGANYITFVGAILAALAMLAGFGVHRFAFFAGAIFSFLSFLCLAIGLVIYTVMISRVIKAVNGFKVNELDGGIHVAYGNGLWIMWAATGAIFFAILPYLIACCTGRRRSSSDSDMPSKEEEY